MKLTLSEYIAIAQTAADLALRLRAAAVAAGATDAQLDAMDARLTAAHNARVAEGK